LKAHIVSKEHLLLNERKLLLKTSQGDEEAFALLFKKHWTTTYNYLKKVTKSAETAEELVSDVFIKIWNDKHRLVDVNNLDAFLNVIARNKAVDFFRRASKDLIIQERIAYEMLNRTQKSADYLVLEAENEQLFNSAVQQLSPQRKLVFTLSKEEGLSHAEIAQRTKLSHQTVKNTLHAALSSIKEYLKDHDTYFLLLFLLISSLIACILF